MIAICSLVITLPKETWVVSGNCHLNLILFHHLAKSLWRVLLGERRIVNAFAIRHCWKSPKCFSSDCVYLATRVVVLLVWKSPHMNPSVIRQDLLASPSGLRFSKHLKFSPGIVRVSVKEPHTHTHLYERYTQWYENQVHTLLCLSSKGNRSAKYCQKLRIWHFQHYFMIIYIIINIRYLLDRLHHASGCVDSIK